MLFVSLNLFLENTSKLLFITITILDLFIKLLFLQGGISNIKHLIFLPISHRIKLIIFIVSPMFSFVNILALLGLFYGNIYAFLISITNTFIVYFLKIELKNIHKYIIFYTIYYFSWVSDFSILLVILFLYFITIELYDNKKYLKINRL